MTEESAKQVENVSGQEAWVFNKDEYDYEFQGSAHVLFPKGVSQEAAIKAVRQWLEQKTSSS